MKQNLYKLILLLCFFSFINSANSQFGILKKVGKETEKKIKKGAEDMIVDKVSDELSRRALRSIDNATDDMLRDAYRREYGDKYTDEQIDSIIASGGADYSKFVMAMDKYDELPDSYHFDIIMDVKTKDYDKKESDLKMYFSSVKSNFAMQQIEDDHLMYLVIDNEKELMAIFSEEDGEKTAQAFSMNMYNQMPVKNSAGTSSSDDGSYMGKMNIRKTGKTKKILGYLSYEAKADGEESDVKAYFSDEVPVNWSQVFSPMMEKMAPGSFSDSHKTLSGTMLENEVKRKEDGKKASWKTKKISLKQDFELEKKDYPSSMAAMEE